ncbi:MAG: hypothetical protein ACLGI6_14780 [Gammaproteobacteria bacterium]
MSTIETAIKLAVDAHAGQRDKAGRPYILHPLRVMHRFTDETLQSIAVLHDVPEDTTATWTARVSTPSPARTPSA